MSTIQRRLALAIVADDADALAVLSEFSASPSDIPQRVWEYLEQAAERDPQRLRPVSGRCRETKLCRHLY